MLERYSEKDSERYTDILQLCECYPEIKFNLPLTYKKIDIATVMEEGIEIKLSDVTPGQTFHLSWIVYKGSGRIEQEKYFS